MFPELVFKYKSIATDEELKRIIDIIKNNRMFFPDRGKLNDPLEGQAVDFELGYAGCSMYRNNDLEDPHIKRELDQYNILSLSSDGFSPQLWAHYGGNYSGICFCYKTENTFNKIKKVEYLVEQKEPVFLHGDFPDFEEHFLCKQIGWAYEKEWRIVKRSSERKGANYFTYKAEDLACIIVGQKIDPSNFKKTAELYFSPNTCFDGKTRIQDV